MMRTGDQKTVVVLGKGRSGTSAVTGVLAILGVAMDAEHNPNAGNPRGDFESREVRDINYSMYKITRGHEFSQQDYLDPLPYKDIMDLHDIVGEDIERFVRRASARDSRWGWKEPQTSLTLELFRPYVKYLHVVVVRRNPEDIATSQVKSSKGAIAREDVLRLVEYYNQEIENFFERHPSTPRLDIWYEALVKDPLDVAQKLADFVELPLTSVRKTEIEKFIIARNKLPQAKKIAGFKDLLLRKIPRKLRRFYSWLTH